MQGSRSVVTRSGLGDVASAGVLALLHALEHIRVSAAAAVGFLNTFSIHKRVYLLCFAVDSILPIIPFQITFYEWREGGVGGVGVDCRVLVSVAI